MLTIFFAVEQVRGDTSNEVVKSVKYYENSSCVEHDEPLRSLLVHDAVAALAAPDRIARADLVLAKKNMSLDNNQKQIRLQDYFLPVAFSANINHGSLNRLDFFIPVHSGKYCFCFLKHISYYYTIILLKYLRSLLCHMF